MIVWLIPVVLLLAYTNGANDNFKGVATLFGSRTANYRRALAWATLMTFAGSVSAAALSTRLVHAFSGKGLVPDAVVQEPTFLLAVGLGAALTVLLATMSGLPISTTHALTGALVGAGLATVDSQINLAQLGHGFLLPLAASPLLACGITALVYPVFRWARLRLGVEKELCLCLDGCLEPVAVQPNGAVVLKSSGLALSVGELRACVERYQGVLLGIDCQWLLDRLHYLSAGLVSFARGLNDTPKIVALLVTAKALDLTPATGLIAVGVAMAIGGLLHARRVAITMSERITPMNHGQGFSANLVTSLLVTLASRFGLPVSTTHVSCGSLFGLGAINRSARYPVVRAIVLAWIVTLPLAACLAAAIYRLTPPLPVQ